MTNTQTRRKLSAEFKSKVALEAISERYTLSELSSRYQVHPNQISRWKQDLIANSVNIFKSPPHQEQDGGDKIIDNLRHCPKFCVNRKFAIVFHNKILSAKIVISRKRITTQLINISYCKLSL
jgi:transposase